MNNLVECYLPIDRYLDISDDCLQYAQDRKTLYMAAHVIHKAHHAVLLSGIYVDSCKEWRENIVNERTWIAFKIICGGIT